MARASLILTLALALGACASTDEGGGGVDLIRSLTATTDVDGKATVVFSRDAILVISGGEVSAGVWTSAIMGSELPVTRPLHEIVGQVRAWIPDLDVDGATLLLPPEGEPLWLPAEWEPYVAPRLLPHQVQRWNVRFGAPE